VRAARRAMQRRHLRRAGVEYAELPTFEGCWPRFANVGSCRLGRRCHFRCFRMAPVLTTLAGGRITVGDFAFLNDGVNICARHRVSIGAHTRLADLVMVYDTDFHAVAPGAGARVDEVVIGKNVWVGAGSIILPGVRIGDHSVVAAGSVVSRDVPARVVVGGAPARLLREFACPDDWVRE